VSSQPPLELEGDDGGGGGFGGWGWPQPRAREPHTLHLQRAQEPVLTSAGLITARHSACSTPSNCRSTSHGRLPLAAEGQPRKTQQASHMKARTPVRRRRLVHLQRKPRVTANFAVHDLINFAVRALQDARGREGAGDAPRLSPNPENHSPLPPPSPYAHPHPHPHPHPQPPTPPPTVHPRTAPLGPTVMDIHVGPQLTCPISFTTSNTSKTTSPRLSKAAGRVVCEPHSICSSRNSTEKPRTRGRTF
jgi:hypothetical protein